MPVVHGHAVRGVDVGPETRCAHYDGPADVVAIRFPCCETYYPCFECHRAVADHEPSVWTVADEPAVLCGVCGTEHRPPAYLAALGARTDATDRDTADDVACPSCGADFNPGCRDHLHRYFASDLYE